MPDAELPVTEHGPVLIVQLNRPESRNALTDKMVRGIGQAVLDAEQRPDIRVVVLTGAGERAFCSGMDLRAFAAGEEIGSGTDPATLAYNRLLRGQVTVPVVGAANGAAIGGGLELLLGCDLVIASDTAKFGLPEVKRGLFPAAGGTDLARRIPLNIALEMTLTGDPITARRGYELGFVNAITPPADVLGTAMLFAERIATNGPLGLTACKELVRLAITDATLAERRMAYWQTMVFTSADAEEGARAFVEKRNPVWQGR